MIVSGKDEAVETLAGFPVGPPEDEDNGLLLVEALMCRGCYAGPGVESKEPIVARGRRVAEQLLGSAFREGHQARLVDEAQVRRGHMVEVHGQQTKADQRCGRT